MRISMPSSQTTRQLRQFVWPLMVTRHSMQTPIPHNGPRGSPDTDRRKRLIPARARAAATTMPVGTETVWPLIMIRRSSDIGG